MGRAPVIQSYWYAIDWDVEAIWRLDLPVTAMPLAPLLWHLDVPLWPFEGEGYAITPRQVMDDPGTYRIEYERMLGADTDYPLDVFAFKGRWMILDGVHRLLKLHIAGRDEALVRVVPEDAVHAAAP